MAYDNTVILAGNVTRDPELRFVGNGSAVASFGIAWNQKDQQGEDKAHFFDVTCWRDLAENVAETVTRGMRVVVYGRLDWRSWETQQGEKRSAVQIVADEVTPSLKWATASVSKRASNSSSGETMQRFDVPNRGRSNEQYAANEEPF